jgi:hypothetical protein
MWSEVLKVALGSAGALLVSWAAFTFKDGGRRGAKRRAIREDLELIELLGEPEFEVAKHRIHARVAVLLRQYEPDADAIRKSRERRLWVGEFAGAVALAVLAISAFDLSGAWSTFVVGGGLGIGVNVLHGIVMGRYDKAEQDQAVHQVAVGDASRPTDTLDVPRGAADTWP